ncbi:LCP family protein required for cell wall assembly [Streptomyces sp. V4I8]
MVLMVAAVGASVFLDLDGNIQVLDIEGKIGDRRPVSLSHQARNILVVGSDSRMGANAKYGHGLESMQSDTLMLVHIAANREWATLVSLPRDSYVEIPACDRGDGTQSTPHHFKINEAFSIGGADGDIGGAVACTIKTVERNSGLHIDHFVVVDFQGFKGMVSALGGIEVCLSEPIHDAGAQLDLDTGCQTVKDEEALGYVRARYSLGDGSDTGRIGRQQEFMDALLRQARQKLTTPSALYGFLDSATKSLTMDRKLAEVQSLYDLALSFNSIPRDRITFLTVPNYPREVEVPTDKANVVWRYPQAQALFMSLAMDNEVDPRKLESAEVIPRRSPLPST